MKTLDLLNPFDAPVYHEEIVSSTFDIARVLAGKNEPNGTVITADFQEAGRGRLGRSWSAEPGKNLLFTLLLRYKDIPSIPQALTLRTGLAVSLGIEDLAPALSGALKIKWPNDIMIDSCDTAAANKTEAAFKAYKTAGILCEGDGANVFIGIGVNIAQKEFPEEYRSKAGSINRVFPAFDENLRFSLLEKILSRLYRELECGHGWRQGVISRLYKKGETVTFAVGPAGSDTLVEGTLSGIGRSGELLIIPKGETEEQAFVTGELRVY